MASTPFNAPSPPKPYEAAGSRGISSAATAPSPAPTASPAAGDLVKFSNPPASQTFPEQFDAAPQNSLSAPPYGRPSALPPPPYPMASPSPYGYGGYGSGSYSQFPPGFGQPVVGVWGKTVAGFETGLQGFGRISQLLQMNFDALHMSFSSLLRLFDHFHLLRSEVGGIAGTFSAIQLFRALHVRVRHRLLAFLGRAVSEEELSRAWNSHGSSASSPDSGLFGWLPLFLTVGLFWTFLRWIYRKVRNSLENPMSPEEKALQEETKKLALIYQLDREGRPLKGPDGNFLLQPGVRIGQDGQPVAGPQPGLGAVGYPMQNGYGGASMSPYGGYGGGYGGGGGYGLGMPMSPMGGLYGGSSGGYGVGYSGYGGGFGGFGSSGGYGGY